MKKYLFIQDHLYGGGAEQICIDTAAGLKIAAIRSLFCCWTEAISARNILTIWI